MDNDNIPRTTYAQRQYGAVHYTASPQRVMGYGNFALMCGTHIPGLTAIRHIPHGAKVCERCVTAMMREKAKKQHSV